MVEADERNRTGLCEHCLTRLAGWQDHVEAMIRGGRRVLDEIAVGPDDGIALVQIGRQGPELHLVENDCVGMRGRCRQTARKDSQRQRPSARGEQGATPRAHDYFRLLASSSACIWCSRKSVRPVCSSDFSSAFLADGIKVDSSAPFTVL